MRITVNRLLLYFDVEGCGLAAQGTQMMARPTLVLLHGGPGADHSFFKPEFSAWPTRRRWCTSTCAARGALTMATGSVALADRRA
jgi:hypothetical protein